MNYTAYTFALSDFVSTSVACAAALAAFIGIGWIAVRVWPSPVEYDNFGEPTEDAKFEPETPPAPTSAVMHAISHPDALEAQETFLRTTAGIAQRGAL